MVPPMPASRIPARAVCAARDPGVGTLKTQMPTLAFTSRLSCAMVNPAPVPVILSFGISNQVITASWSSAAGSTYALQSTTNLLATNWVNVASPVTASGATASLTNAIGNAPQQFYRVALVPGN